MARIAVGCLVIGALLLMVAPGHLAHAVGLGVWWFGALVVIDLFIGGGLAAQILWAVGVAAAVAALQYGWVGSIAEGVGPIVCTVLSVPFIVVAVVVTRRRRSVSAGLRELADQILARPADPTVSIARLQVAMTERIEKLRPEHARDALDLARLLSGFTAKHGQHTVKTSLRPDELRTAVTKLARDMASIRQRRATGTPGHTHRVVITRYAELLRTLATRSG
ncbi:MAG TPA: hypothetical protein VGD48_34725 [Kutzneria sp.]|jgi:hypothetical protein